MRRLAPLILGLCLLAPPTAGADADADVQDRTSLGAALTSCRTGADEQSRAATFTGQMPALGADRLWMRFDLFRRAARDGAWLPVLAPNFGAWEKSEPGRPAFIFTKRVAGLTGPAAYRAVVRFRWYDAGGRLLRTARRQTKPCRQPDTRPDLVAGALDGFPTERPDVAIYRLVVRNDGREAAGPFSVRLGEATARVDGLPGGERRPVSFVAPRCTPGSTMHVVLDSGSEVLESHEADDVAELACPFVG